MEPSLNKSATSVTAAYRADDVMILILKMLTVVCNSVICSLIAIFGLGANVINMLVFSRSGLKNSINLSFFCRSASDVIRILSILWSGVSLNPYIVNIGAPLAFGDVFYATGGMISSCTTRVTIWITLYVTVERYLCVLYPLQIKNIITPARTGLVMLLIFAFSSLSFIPVYSNIRLEWVYSSDRNKTILTLVYKEKRLAVESLSYVINNTIISIGLILLFLTSLLLIFLLKSKSRWRMENSADRSKVKVISERDARLMALVLIVALVVIACFTPRMLLTAVSAIVPDFNTGGRYEAAYRSAHSVLYILSAFDSSVNIFIYFNISTKYRENFYALLSFKYLRLLSHKLSEL